MAKSIISIDNTKIKNFEDTIKDTDNIKTWANLTKLQQSFIIEYLANNYNASLAYQIISKNPDKKFCSVSGHIMLNSKGVTSILQNLLKFGISELVKVKKAINDSLEAIAFDQYGNPIEDARYKAFNRMIQATSNSDPNSYNSIDDKDLVDGVRYVPDYKVRLKAAEILLRATSTSQSSEIDLSEVIEYKMPEMLSKDVDWIPVEAPPMSDEGVGEENA
jgi:hypothetical protein